MEEERVKERSRGINRRQGVGETSVQEEVLLLVEGEGRVQHK